MILEVAKIGHPILRKTAQVVALDEIRTPEFQGLVDSMIETMREHEGVGIAGPQVHVSKRVFCVECVDNSRYPRTPHIPLYIVINPRVRILDPGRIFLWEGCLSVPGLRGQVGRARKLELTGRDRRGRPLKKVVQGFHARIIQHEYDHLEGRVYLDRMRSLKSLSFLEYLK